MQNDKMSLRAARTNAGKTQQEVADHMNVNVNTVSNWENNPRSISAIMFFDLIKFYNCSVDAISLYKI